MNAILARIAIVFILASTTMKAAAQEVASVFNIDSIHEIHLSFPQKNFRDSLLYFYNTYHEADSSDDDILMADALIDGIKLDSIGVKYKGNFSFTIPSNKKSMKLDFNAYKKDRLFQNLRGLGISNEFPDPSMLRNTVAYKLLRDAGIKAPHTSFARVYINNSYTGLYVLTELIDKSFIETYMRNPGGELIKTLSSSLAWNENDTNSIYRNFRIKKGNNPDAWLKLSALMEKINSTESSVFYDSLKDRLDFESYLPVLAADVVFNNWDSYFYGQNYYLYRDTIVNRYYYIPWDYNVSLNNYSVSGGDFPILDDGDSHIFNLPLPKKILENKILKAKYLDKICEMYALMDYDTLEPYIIKLHNLILPSLTSDPGKSMTIAQYKSSLTDKVAISEITYIGMLKFIKYRHEQLRQMLKIEGKKCE